WSHVSTILDQGIDQVASIAAGVYTDNTIHVVYSKDVTGGAIPNAAGIYHVKSTDAGVTWSAETYILDGASATNWNEVSLTITPNQRIHVAAICTPSGSPAYSELR